MNGFTDIHTHILPGVDDGAQDMSQARRLLRMAWENGTRTVFLTPHYRGKYKKHTPAKLRENFHWLRELLQDEFPDMRILLGSEVAYEADAPEAMVAGTVLTLNDSRYVLLEFQTTALRSQILAGVSETIRCGFTPIVAHIERYNILRRDPAFAEELREMGALLQLNADSVMGRNGFGIKHLCHKLLKAGLAQFIASDSHDQKHRPPTLRKCFLHIHKKYGPEYALALFHDNAQAIIENKVIY